MMKELGYFNLRTSLRTKKGRKRETKSIIIYESNYYGHSFQGNDLCVVVVGVAECKVGVQGRDEQGATSSLLFFFDFPFHNVNAPFLVNVFSHE